MFFAKCFSFIVIYLLFGEVCWGGCKWFFEHIGNSYCKFY